MSSTEPAPRPASSSELPPPRPEIRPLRVWPLVIVLVLLLASRGLPFIWDEVPSESTLPLFFLFLFAPAALGVVTIIWWLAASRATWMEKLVGLGALLALLVGTFFFSHSTVQATVYLNHGVPIALLLIGLTLCGLCWWLSRTRTWIATAVAVVALGAQLFLRSDGVTGDFLPQLHWRWTPTKEQEFLAKSNAGKTTAAEGLPATSEELAADSPWPGFRGPNMDSSVPGVRLDPDWEAHPPRLVWRKLVGPGWASFAVGGGRLFTQEQRGEQEVVVCYDAASGEQLWAHEDKTRFEEALAGAGPRATPTLSAGRLFTQGASGLLTRLDPITGAVLWQRDLQKDASRPPPQWGFSASPLVVEDKVLTYAGGEGDQGVLAYDVETGDPCWGVAAGVHTYASPQLAKIAGQTVVLMVTEKGLTAVEPAQGKLAWEYQFATPMYRVLQPAVVDGSDVIVATGMSVGLRRVKIDASEGGVSTSEQWDSRALKPDYNDYVVHDGHIYGFDLDIFVCLSLEDGRRQWKQGRYGKGQVLLLPDAQQLLVLSETGQLVLLEANPREHRELAQFQALEGKTWNHPVLVGNRVYVRNDAEMACYELTLADGSQ